MVFGTNEDNIKCPFDGTERDYEKVPLSHYRPLAKQDNTFVAKQNI